MNSSANNVMTQKLSAIREELTRLGVISIEYPPTFRNKRVIHLVIDDEVDESEISKFVKEVFDDRYYSVSMMKESERENPID